MARSKYKRYSRGGRFRQQGDGLRAAVDEIRQQRQIEIDALKQQALNQNEVSKMQISGLSNVARNESDNRRILNNLEDKIYQTKRNAIAVKGQREVENLLGQAKEFSNEAEFWESFATKHSKNYGKLATELTDFAQYRAAINAYQQMSEDEKADATTAYDGAYDTVEKDSETGIYDIPDFKDRKELLSRTHGWFANNHHLHRMLAQDYRQTIQNRVNLVRLNSKTEDGVNLYNKDTAAQLLLNSAYLYMYENGIPFNSKAGRDILAITNQQITAETNAFATAHQFKIDKENIQVQLQTLTPFITNYDEDPEAFWNQFNVFHEVVQGSVIEGDNGEMLLPGDPLRSSFTPKQNLAITIDFIIDNFQFESIEQALDVLNVPVRDLGLGTIVLNKEGTPAEYILDKHPALKDVIIERITEKLQNSKTERELNSLLEIESKGQVYVDEYEESLKTGNFENTLLDKEWRLKVFELAANPNYKDSNMAYKLFQIIGYDPEQFGQNGYSSNVYQNYNNMTDLFLSGDINGALSIFAQLQEVPSSMRGLHESINAALSIPNFQVNLETYVTQEFESYLPALLTGVKTHDKNDLDEMVRLGTSRWMTIWSSLSHITDPNARWAETKKLWDAEVKLGLDKGEGWAAASSNDPNNLNAGYTFHYTDKLNTVAQTGQPLSQDGIAELFKGYEDDNFMLGPISVTIEGLDTKEFNTMKLKAIIDNNLAKLISNNDARQLFAQITTGTANNTTLPDNLREFIVQAKTLYPEATTSEIMNLVIKSIYTQGDTIWDTPDITVDGQTSYRGINQQFEGLAWPVDLEDFTKTVCGTSTNNDTDNVTLCLYNALQENDIDLNKLFSQEVLNSIGVP